MPGGREARFPLSNAAVEADTAIALGRVAAAALAVGESVIKCPSPLNALKNSYDCMYFCARSVKMGT
jgi:hypothetical protein